MFLNSMIENQGTTANLFEKINPLLRGSENRKDFDREALQQKMVDLGIRGLTQYNIGWLIGAKDNRMAGLYNKTRYIYVYEETALKVLHELYRDGMDFEEVRKMVAEETLRRMGFLELDAVEIEDVEDVSLGRVTRLIDIIREELKRGEVSLAGSLRKKLLRDELIDSRVEGLEGLLLSLKKVGKECDSIIDKLIGAYCDNFKLLIRRCLKVVDRSKMGDIDITLLIDELLIDYPELVGFFVDGKFKGLRSKMFKDAAVVNTYFSRDQFEEVLTDENIMEALREEGLEMEEEEMIEVFTRARRLLLAVKYRANPLEGVKKVGRNVEEVLTDENIMEALKEEGLEMEEEEMRVTFTRGLRLFLGIYNIGKPLEAVKNVGRNVKEVLTDENIMRALREEGLEMEEEEMRVTFTRARRLLLAVKNRAKPLEGVKKVGRNVEKVLTDENIMRALREEGLEMEEEEMIEVFTKGRRLLLALHNISKPLEGVKKVGRNVEKVLTDENIMKALKEEGLEMEEEEMIEVFTRGLRLMLAVSNRAKPLEGLKKLGRNVEKVLTDENIMEALKEEGLEMEEEEMIEVFTKGRRLLLAVSNRAKPLEAVKKVGRNVEEVLTDENIMKALKEEGLEMEEEEMIEVFTRGRRLRLAIGNIVKPLEGVKKVGRNVEEVLTDENIMKALKEEGLEMGEEEMREVFNRGRRLKLAEGNISKPLEGVKKVGRNVEEVLTDENIMEALREEGLEMEEEEMIEVFTKGRRLRLAIYNRVKPLEGVKKVGRNVEKVLTDENIMKALKEEGLEMEEEEMIEVFTRKLRLFLALYNKANPLDGVLNYFKGDLKYGGYFFKESHPGLYRKYFE